MGKKQAENSTFIKKLEDKNGRIEFNNPLET